MLKLARRYAPTAMAVPLKLFVVGDVMLGRGVDQILEHKNDPILYESYVKDATEYVELAIRLNGPLPTPRDNGYVWGDSLQIIKSQQPQIKIINLETAVTTHATPAPRKGIHYRMHPLNIQTVSTADIDCIVLSNNHVLDWCQAGLLETLRTVECAGMKYVGAGASLEESQAPAVFPLPNGHRLLVFGAGHPSSGVIGSWAATAYKPGVHYIDTNDRCAERLANLVRKYKQPGDVVLFSIHWGGNWEWDVEPEHVDFAHKLIDDAGVDIIHGHSSHHVKGFEVYKGKLILYGCGDFLTDYEGIASASLIQDEEAHFRDDLSLMYFPSFDVVTGRLIDLTMAPMHLRRLQVVRAEGPDREWLWRTMVRECGKWGVTLKDDGEYFRVDL